MSETFGIQSYRGEYYVHFTGDIAKVLDEQVAPDRARERRDP